MADTTVHRIMNHLPHAGTKASVAGPAAPFSDTLKGAIAETNTLIHAAEKTALNVVTGSTGNLHEAMIALEKADISFKVLLQVRNKVLEAYQEIMRMQI